MACMHWLDTDMGALLGVGVKVRTGRYDWVVADKGAVVGVGVYNCCGKYTFARCRCELVWVGILDHSYGQVYIGWMQ